MAILNSFVNRAERKLVKGDTPDEKFKSIERTLKHMALLMNKSAVVAVAPTQLFGYSEDPKNDPIIRAIVGLRGTLKSVFLSIEAIAPTEPESKVDEATILVDVTSADGNVSRNIKAKKGVMEVALEIPMEPGDTIMTKVKSNDVVVSGVSMCFVIESNIPSALLKKIAVADMVEKALEIEDTE